jgi:NADH-quinone oxidoreductase subunit G
MAVVYVNDKPVDIGAEKLNLIQAAKKAGVFVPHYCWHEALTVVASCRMCLVEVGDKKPDGTVAMQPKVVPGCQTPAKDGTVIVTNSKKAREAQMQTLEGLLLNHPLDCPVCDKAGECTLQDYSYGYGKSQSRMIDVKNTPPNKPNIGPNVTLFADRCILCSRCVRFTREISGEAELQVINRGDHSEIDVFPGEPLDNKLASNVVDLCPVGALCSKDFLYTHRVWNLKTENSVCADCSTGCSTYLDGNKNIVYRLRPRYNPQAQGHFMCDDGRLGYHYVNSKERFLRPAVRRGGELVPVAWPEVTAEIRQAFTTAAAREPASVVGVLSPFLTCEEAYLLAKFLKGLSPQVRLALGPIPIVGEDDTYPKDRRGQPIQPVKFTIRAEKCPNRRGVEAVLNRFQGKAVSFDEVVGLASEGKVKALYLAAGYPPRPGHSGPLAPRAAGDSRSESPTVERGSSAPRLTGDSRSESPTMGWISETQAQALQKVPLVVCHDLSPSPVSAFAQYILPGATFAEKEGTFVNHAGLAQGLHWGVTPTGECRTDGQVFLDLLQRRGLVHAPTLRKELAREIKYFAPLAGGDLGEYGILLEQAK